MTIERNQNEVIIKVPASIGIEEVQGLIDYLTYKIAVSKSKAKQSAIDELAREANKNWWERNKDKLMPS